MNKAKKYIILFTICIVILGGAVFLLQEKNIRIHERERMHICVSGFDMEYEEKDLKEIKWFDENGKGFV